MFFFICLAWLRRQSNRVNVQFTGRSLDKFRARDVYKLVECNRLGVCIEKETAEVVGSTSVELEADTDGEEDDTDSEEVELAVIIAGVIRITGVQGSNLAGKVGSKHTGVVGSKLAGLVLSWLVRVELVEFELSGQLRTGTSTFAASFYQICITENEYSCCSKNYSNLQPHLLTAR